MMYKEYEVFIPSSESKRLKNILQNKAKMHGVKIRINRSHQAGDDKTKLLLTAKQISRIEKGKRKAVNIAMSRRQIGANMKYEGGFLSMLAGLAAKALPTILTGLAAGAISGAIEKSVSGDGLYVQKGKHCYRADPVEGDGLFLSKHPNISQGDGLFLKQGQNIYNGDGLLLGANSPFKNIPVLGWIL